MTRFYFKFGLATLVLLLMALFARAQGMVVSGKVTDETGSGLPGVNVIIKGSTTGSTTDSEGKYSIGNVSNNSILVFSFIGYDYIKKRSERNTSVQPSVGVC